MLHPEKRTHAWNCRKKLQGKLRFIVPGTRSIIPSYSLHNDKCERVAQTQVQYSRMTLREHNPWKAKKKKCQIRHVSIYHFWDPCVTNIPPFRSMVSDNLFHFQAIWKKVVRFEFQLFNIMFLSITKQNFNLFAPHGILTNLDFRLDKWSWGNLWIIDLENVEYCTQLFSNFIWFGQPHRLVSKLNKWSDLLHTSWELKWSWTEQHRNKRCKASRCVLLWQKYMQ